MNHQLAQTERSYMGTAGSLAGVAPRAPEIPTHMERLEKSMAYALDSFNELAARLSSVTRPASPDVGKETNGSLHDVPGTQHGEWIAANTRNLHALGDRIQDLLRRIEV